MRLPAAASSDRRRHPHRLRGSPLALVQARLVAEAFVRAGRPTQTVVVQTDGDRRRPTRRGARERSWPRSSARCCPAASTWRSTARRTSRPIRIRGCTSRPICPEPTPATRWSSRSGRTHDDSLICQPEVVSEPTAHDERVSCSPGDTTSRSIPCTATSIPGCAGSTPTRPTLLCLPAPAWTGSGSETGSPSAWTQESYPGPGQGAIAIQTRADDGLMLALAATIDDRPTRQAVETERAFLKASGGGCRAPLGALASVVGARSTCSWGVPARMAPASHSLVVEDRSHRPMS